MIKCVDVVKDPNTGEVIELLCEYDPLTKGGNTPDGRRIQGTIHWLSVKHAQELEVRLYDNLFMKENPNEVEEGKTYLDNINPDSLSIIRAKVEPSLRSAKPGEKYQFERLGYFCVDSKHSKPNEPVFNRTVTLRDTWAKIAAK